MAAPPGQFIVLQAINAFKGKISAVADPGFSQGGRQLPRGVPTYDFAKFSRKLHEIERIWVPGGGGAHAPCAPLNPPLFGIKHLILPKNISIDNNLTIIIVNFVQISRKDLICQFTFQQIPTFQ